MSNVSTEYAIAKLQARMDAEAIISKVKETREDAPQCKPGNKACGSRCIPQAQKCKKGGGVVKGAAIAGGIGAAAVGAYLLSRKKEPKRVGMLAPAK